MKVPKRISGVTPQERGRDFVLRLVKELDSMQSRKTKTVRNTSAMTRCCKGSGPSATGENFRAQTA